MDFNQIQELIRLVSKQKLTEFVLKQGDFKLIIRQGGADSAPVVTTSQPVVVAAAPAVIPAAAPPAAPVSTVPVVEAAPAADTVAGNTVAIKSPMVGTFYRSPGPDKPAFVKVGDVVDMGSKVCIIEAMKLFNEIESEVKGKIVKVLVEDATPVEYDQPLFLVEPA